MPIESTISAYQKVLPNFCFATAQTFSENFAQQRYKKKMEEPDESKADERAQRCWDSWLTFDSQLPTQILLPHPMWYRARLLIHDWMREFATSQDVDFPSGSSVIGTKGYNSIEAWLSAHRWTCTEENLSDFHRLVCSHKALKRAFKRRYNRWYREANFDLTLKESNHLLWQRLRCSKRISFWKFERVVSIVRGSRFSRVPKNNVDDRPINIEPLGNVMVQRQIGVGIRNLLKKVLHIDLKSLQHTHRNRIKSSIATIDLKNASDAISTALVEFLFPSWFVEKLHKARCDMVYGFDGEYHMPKKISSMGNGFTFELMTLILTALCRVLDDKATVFGDDIIVSKEVAPSVVSHLESVGFVVNKDKSFLSGPFRESCGGNYHDDEGYIESYDFKYPTSIADCALIYNKAAKLGRRYPSFKELEQTLRNITPKALRGGALDSAACTIDPWTLGYDEDLPIYFGCNAGVPIPARGLKRHYHYREVKKFPCFVYVNTKRSRLAIDLKVFHWAKYEMYLSAGGKTEDQITGRGSWVQRDILQCDGLVGYFTEKG